MAPVPRDVLGKMTQASSGQTALSASHPAGLGAFLELWRGLGEGVGFLVVCVCFFFFFFEMKPKLRERGFRKEDLRWK